MPDSSGAASLLTGNLRKTAEVVEVFWFWIVGAPCNRVHHLILYSGLCHAPSGD